MAAYLRHPGRWTRYTVIIASRVRGIFDSTPEECVDILDALERGLR